MFSIKKNGAAKRNVGMFVGMNGASFFESGYSCGFAVVVVYLT